MTAFDVTTYTYSCCEPLVALTRLLSSRTSIAWGSATERPSWTTAACAAEARQVDSPLSCHAEHKANSDKDCDGVCFGTNLFVCNVHINATTTDVTLTLGVTRDTYNASTSLSLSNTGSHACM